MPALQSLALPARLPLLDNEVWWGGRTADGIHMPFAADRAPVALAEDLNNNQGAPLLLSSHGRAVTGALPFSYGFDQGRLVLDGPAREVQLHSGAGDLRGAYHAAHGPATHPRSGELPPEVFFTGPQYNTWIEFTHFPHQQGVLDYARGLLDNGFPPGVLMIDAGWSEHFGSFEFHSGRFPDPGALVAELKSMGFAVMLWVAPFLTPDTPLFRQLRGKPEWFLRNAAGQIAIVEWWDGHSAHYDITHPEVFAWYTGELRGLMERHGVDGFKFDAGDTAHYRGGLHSHAGAAPTEITRRWADLALQFPFNELRACWEMGRRPLVQRLHDRAPAWDARGLGSLLPNGLAMGLLGHSFICPDMIGGGDYLYFKSPQYRVDEENFIRSAQASALFPMMQFSCAPWRVLGEEGRALCRQAAALHTGFADEILAVARAAAARGEPMVRHLEWAEPHRGHAQVSDQFLLGDDLLVAPVLQAGARERRVVLPAGAWALHDGTVYDGGRTVTVPAPLDSLPWFRRRG